MSALTPPSAQPPGQIASEEDVTCFIYDGRHYSIREERAKYGAFLPDKDGERSVFRTIYLSEDHIKFVGQWVGAKRSKTLLARGTLKVQGITDQGLSIEPQENTEIPLGLGKWHSVIIGWPSDREGQKLLAIQLADSAHPDFYSE